MIQDLVIADIQARKRVGIERYGTPLQPHNGRDVDRDLYEELLDATMYQRSRMVERDTIRRKLHELAIAVDQGLPQKYISKSLREIEGMVP